MGPGRVDETTLGPEGWEGKTDWALKDEAERRMERRAAGVRLEEASVLGPARERRELRGERRVRRRAAMVAV